MTYKQRQAQFFKEHNLKKGDKVIVVKKLPNGCNGWENSWNSDRSYREDMDSYIGEVCTILRDVANIGKNGIPLSKDSNGHSSYCFSYESLQPLKQLYEIY